MLLRFVKRQRQELFMNLKVNELFYSLQGEGGRTGEASIFIRLSDCNLRCDFCDTSFDSGEELSLDEILSRIQGFPCKWIIWTGGEPTLQLTDEVLLFFKRNGYKQAIESNGCFHLSELLDYTVCSPKGDVEYARNENRKVNEVRLPAREGDKIPSIDILPEADIYCLSPIFCPDMESTKRNITFCVEYIKRNPVWKLSLQTHKLIGIE